MLRRQSSRKPQYLDVCACTCTHACSQWVPCISEDERIWQHRPKKNRCPQTENLRALRVYMCTRACAGTVVFLCLCVYECGWTRRLRNQWTSVLPPFECPFPWCLSVCAHMCALLWPKTDPVSDNIHLWVAGQSPGPSSELGPGLTANQQPPD